MSESVEARAKSEHAGQSHHFRMVLKSWIDLRRVRAEGCDLREVQIGRALWVPGDGIQPDGTLDDGGERVAGPEIMVQVKATATAAGDACVFLDGEPVEAPHWAGRGQR